MQNREHLLNEVDTGIFQDTGEQFIEVKIFSKNAFDVLHRIIDGDYVYGQDMSNYIYQVSQLLFHTPYGLDTSYSYLLELVAIEYIDEIEYDGPSFYTLVFVNKRMIDTNDMDMQHRFIYDIADDDNWIDLMLYN